MKDVLSRFLAVVGILITILAAIAHVFSEIIPFERFVAIVIIAVILGDMITRYGLVKRILQKCTRK